MKKIASAFSLLLLITPLTALAHEHRTYKIGDKEYNITVGAIGEPVHVDDKSGVEVIVQQLGGQPIQEHMADGMEENDDGPVGMPVAGLEKTLKVEVSAGDQKKTFDLEPQWGQEGSYEAVFYPTVQTTYSYRLTGTLNAVPVDLTFTCNPAGHPMTEDNTTSVKMSDKVTQTGKGGAFGCPEAKADVQFPEQGDSVSGLTSEVRQLQEKAADAATMNIAGLIAGVLGIAIGVGAWFKASHHTHV